MQPRNASNHEITGVLSRISQIFENDNGTRIVIADVMSLGQKVVVKGQAKESELIVNRTYRFYGRYKTHPKYGDQFFFEQFVADEPSGQYAICCHLESLSGVGKFTAMEIWNRFGEESLAKLRTDPIGVAEALPKRCMFTADKAKKASIVLQRTARIEKAKTELVGLLAGRRVPKKTIDKILDDYGSAAADVLRQNPYLLSQFRGCSFLTADRLYLDLGGCPFRLARQARCCTYSVTKQSTGDTWHPMATAREYLRESIAGAEQRFDEALRLSIRAGILESKTDRMGTVWVADPQKSRVEASLASFVSRATKDASSGFSVLWPDVDGLPDLTEHQKEALAAATKSHIGIFSGSPGAGKTFCIARLVAKIIDLYGAQSICICAPTGKASTRATESMQSAKINMIATTTHSLLGMEMSNSGEFRFSHNESNPLKFNFIIVDESPMLDVPLMNSLFAARRSGAHILFVGDINQLSPVGHGAPLRDMILAGIPTGTLTKIERNSGRIVRACAEIRDHKRFTPSPTLDIKAGENLLHVEADSPESQISAMLQILHKITDNNKYDPVWDTQIVCAVNMRSPISRHRLNQIIQDELNPNVESNTGSSYFRVADKIVSTKNSRYESAVTCAHADANGNVYVANGEQAEILELLPGKIIVRLWSPDRTNMIPRGESREANSDNGDDPGASDSGEPEKETVNTGCNFELGYAVSCHKSQGSDWPFVVVMLDDSGAAKMVQSRNWIYTAISRAKTVCFTIGKKSTADAICLRDGLRRKTFLAELIREKLGTIEQEKTNIDEYASIASYQDMMDEALNGVS